MEQKTHYRKVFKSDHLGVADLEELKESGKTRLIYTIKEVKQEINVSVAGRKGDHNIAYFKENIKPLVLNATNSKVVRGFAKDKSPFVEDWKNILIELYIDASVRMKGSVVGGVRIKTTQPTISKPELKKDTTKWDEVVKYLNEGKNKDEIKSRMKAVKARLEVSSELEKELTNEI